jgi:hypothetical protein
LNWKIHYNKRLSGVFVVLQVLGCHGFPFDPSALFYNGLPTPEVDVCGSEVVYAFVVSLMVIKIDEHLDLRLEVCWKEVVV